MKHRIYHSSDLTTRLADYAARLNVPEPALAEAYDWMAANNVIFEERDAKADELRVYVAFVNIETRIEHPLARRFYAMLRDEVPASFVPRYGINWPTFKDRWLRAWEQWYNILINKIPSHTVRIWWLRLGGAKIGKGSSVWRNTEVIGIENLRIGDDTAIGWHCLLDARGGLIIGNHVTIASYVLIIAGGHDTMSPEFWALGEPIYIHDYTWIASRAMVISGAHIGEGAIVVAGTIVNKKIAPYKIVGGSGAKPIADRPQNLSYKVGGKGLFTLFH
jgi:acetyltransferase-like isoleucine patch superfamily enzyme